MNVSETMQTCVITTDNFEVKERVMILHNLSYLAQFASHTMGYVAILRRVFYFVFKNNIQKG